MRDYINIGSSPCGVECAQLGSDGYYEHATLECEAFIGQLNRIFPDATCKFRRKGFEHDFGTYYEVVAVYDDQNEQQMKDAFRAEAETPEFWDSKAKIELRMLIGSLPEDVRPFNDIVKHFKSIRDSQL